MTEQLKPTIEIHPLKKMILAKNKSQMDFLVRILAPKSGIKTKRPTLNLGLVLDRSGSMGGSKIQKAKEATSYCLDQMLETDRFSLTIFDNEIDVIVPSVHPKNRSKIKSVINTIEARSTTALHPAWVQGGKQVASHLDSKMLNRVILITDGLANAGETNTDVIVTQAKGLYEHGISTTTIGVGNDFNEELLVPMAQSGGGNNWFVESAKDFQRIFETEMEGLVRERFSNVLMEIEPENGVEILEVMNDFERDFENKFILPNLVDEEPLDIIVRTQLPARDTGIHRIFKINLEWNLIGNDTRQNIKMPASIEYAEKIEGENEKEYFQVQKVIKLLEAARIKRQAIAQLDNGDYMGSSQTLQAIAPMMRDLAEQYDDDELAAEANYLDEFSDKVQVREERAYSRKSMRYSSINTQRGKKVR